MRKKIVPILFITLLGIFTLISCAEPNDDMDSTNTISPIAANEAQLGDFKAQDINGNEVTKDIFSNYDLTLVNLFTTWCSPCVEEIPYLSQIDKELSAKGVNVIGIVLDVNEDGKIDDKKLEKLKEIIQSTNAGYDILLPDSVLREGRLKGVDSVPESFFVDKNGNIVGETYVGSHSKEEWIDIINKELDKIKK
ncbi:TlpA disulfide reductase family protein [Sinanaerobacter sp. ZZT-01]|uniref:TlpA family protein disulfide reductase n=1 Tax=Sinanaerobacter sp. ZZT-01 TaxID=3111540 RepID=UPI002D77EDA8|nr:TlpA disulfide reductase family protein [Sinanaerobacter sp. ZZT-01]WRR93423.1 TlpA disulfide reductase family protein [Sinanaerobacter sp. ZZT-01]